MEAALTDLLRHFKVGPRFPALERQPGLGCRPTRRPLSTRALLRKLVRLALWPVLVATLLDAHALPERLTLNSNRDLQCTFWAGFGIAMPTLDGLDLHALRDDDVFRERMQDYVNNHLRRYNDALKAATPPGALAGIQKDVDEEVRRKTATETLRMQAFLSSQRDRLEGAKAYITSKLKGAQCRPE